MSGRRQLSNAENIALGGATALLSTTVAAPIERVKLLLQSQGEILKSGRLREPYRGAIDCTARVLRSEGLRHFWRGNLVSCLHYFPNQALTFALSYKVKALFSMSKTDSHGVILAKNVLSGSMTGALALSFVYPLGYARTRLANDILADSITTKGQSRQFNGLIDVYRKTIKTDGFVGMYRGFVIACLGIAVYRGCYFGFFDTLRPIVLGDQASLFSSYALGYIVTVSAGLVAYPLDTICHRMMMRSNEPIKYKGSLDCARQILTQEGPMAFMRGAGVSIIRGFVGAGVLVGYNKIREIYIAFRFPQ